MSLTRLLRSHLGPYRKLLAIVVVLQAVQTAAMLMLPGLNADIIDRGVLTGDNAFIRRTGAVMIGFTIVQIVFAAFATWYGAKAAMSFGRDVRTSLFTRVLDYSAEEVGHFGAPSLITRITNDVQQVQIMVVTACTMMIAAPLTMVIGVFMAVREDAGLSVVLLVSIPAAVLILGNVVRRMVPAFQLMQERVDRVNQVLREQITGIRVVRAFVREPEETARFAQANDDLTRHRAPDRASDGRHVPDGDVHHQRLEHPRALGRRRPHRRRRHAARRPHRVPELSDPDPDGGRHGHLHGVDDPSRSRGGRAHPGGARHPDVDRPGGEPGHRGVRPGPARVPGRHVPLPRRRASGPVADLLLGARRRDHGDHREHRCRQDDAGEPDPAALRRLGGDRPGRRRRRP